jgi:hypothetical protein
MSHVSKGKLQETTKHCADKVMCGRYVAPFLPPDQLISFLHGEPQVAKEYLTKIIMMGKIYGNCILKKKKNIFSIHFLSKFVKREL